MREIKSLRYKPNDTERQVMQALALSGAASIKCSTYKQARYQQNRIRSMLRVAGIGPSVKISVKSGVVFLWMLAQFNYLTISREIYDTASLHENSFKMHGQTVRNATDDTDNLLNVFQLETKQNASLSDTQKFIKAAAVEQLSKGAITEEKYKEVLAQYDIIEEEGEDNAKG